MFKILGELINNTRKNVNEATKNRDVSVIQNLVIKQIKSGAHWLDINGGARAGNEHSDMEWLLQVVQEVSAETPLSLDSNDPFVLQEAYDKVRVKPLINSTSLETHRWNGLAPFLEGKDCDILALCTSDKGLPKTANETVKRAEELVGKIRGLGFPDDSIYVDPVIQPISTDVTKGSMVLEAITMIKRKFPYVHTCCGLSNVSYGLPQRKLINRHFLTMLISVGMDSAIMDPLDKGMMESLRTSLMLLGQDRFCRNFLSAVRSGDIPAQ